MIAKKVLSFLTTNLVGLIRSKSNPIIFLYALSRTGNKKHLHHSIFLT